MSTDLQQKVAQLEKTVSTIESIIRGLSAWPDPWIDLKRACKMKGISYETVRKFSWRMPNGGAPDAIINNRKYWRPETIREWILLSDQDLAHKYKGDNQWH